MSNREGSATSTALRRFVQEARKVAVSIPRAMALVWRSAPALTLAMLILNVLAAFLPVLSLWATKLTIDRIAAVAGLGEAAPVDLRPLWLLVGVLALLWLVTRATDALNNTLSSLMRFRVEMHAQVLIMRKCADLDVVFFENPKNLDVLENASRGAMMSAWTLVSMLVSIIRNLVTIAIFLGVLARLHWLASVVVAVTTAPQMLASAYYARRRWQMRTDMAEDSRLRFYLTWLVSQRDPAKEVRVFSLTDYVVERFESFCRKFFDMEWRLDSRRERINLLLGLLGVAGTVGIWVYVVLRAVVKDITLGDVFLYTQAVANCEGNLLSLFTQGGQLYEQTLFLGNLFALLDLDPGSVEGALRGPNGSARRWGDLPAPARVERGIEFRNVSFRYPGSDKWVLRNVSFRVSPGESVAVVGRNGAGKTTLVKLLVRLYDPTEGDILLDGHNLREYDLESLRRFFGVIFQDYARYNLTLRENIGFGDVRRVHDIERVKDAARKGGAGEIAQRLSREYETYLGRQFVGLGEDLSGGEWQRVAISRAYMRDCPVMILDEPTASLDAFAEYEVYSGFARLAETRTVVLISHRFSTVRTAGHILVLEEGALVEDGTHDVLLARRGLYASMFETQAERYR